MDHVKGAVRLAECEPNCTGFFSCSFWGYVGGKIYKVLPYGMEIRVILQCHVPEYVGYAVKYLACKVMGWVLHFGGEVICALLRLFHLAHYVTLSGQSILSSKGVGCILDEIGGCSISASSSIISLCKGVLDNMGLLWCCGVTSEVECKAALMSDKGGVKILGSDPRVLVRSCGGLVGCVGAVMNGFVFLLNEVDIGCVVSCVYQGVL
eukprot:15333587-Ditylum_brightwellii.AAC.1